MDDEVRQRFAQGRDLFYRGHYAEAEPILVSLAENHPGFADVQNMLGVVYHDQGHFQRAQEAFEMALKINPGYTEAALNLAVIYNDSGRYGEARSVYEAAFERAAASPNAIDPYVQKKIANLYADIGDVFIETGHLDNAVAEYRRALLLGPGFIDIRLKLAGALRDAGHRDAAVAELESCVRDHPQFVPARIALGVAYFGAGRHGEAETAWRESLAQRPGDRLAQMYLSLLQPQSAAGH